MSAKREKRKHQVEKRIYKSKLFMKDAIKPPKWRVFKYKKWLKLKFKAPKGCK